MSDLTLFEIAEVTVHCFWSPRCKHVVRDFDPHRASALMEAHYAEVHEADIDRIVLNETGAKPKRIIPSAAVRAVGRFEPGGPTGFRAVEPWAKDAPVRASREEAFADIEERP